MSATNPEHTSTILMTVTLPAAKASALANWQEGFIDRTIWTELDPGYYVMEAFDFMSFVLFEEESPRGIPVRALYVPSSPLHQAKFLPGKKVFSRRVCPVSRELKSRTIPKHYKSCLFS